MKAFKWLFLLSLVLTAGCGSQKNKTTELPDENESVENQTTNVKVESKVLSEDEISAYRDIGFVSKYTEYGGQSGDCQWLDDGDEQDGGGADIPFQCKGYGGYYIYTYFSAFSAHIMVQHPERDYDQYLTEQKIDFIDENRKIEWRFADGKPFCIIIRVKKYNEDSDKRHSQYENNTNSGEELIVRGLQNFEGISYNIDTKKTKNANLKAREVADEGYREMTRSKASGM